MAAPRTTKVVRKASEKADDQRIVILRTEWVPTNSLHPHPQNPNEGSVEDIAISLNENGQFKPIVVNIGTKTGRPNEILAGNHTWLACRMELDYQDTEGTTRRKLPWSQIYVSFVDVDEVDATAILLADNETAAKAQRNQRKVAELIASLPTVKQIATGHNVEEIQDIMSRAKAAADEALANAERIRDEQRRTDEAIAKAKTFSGSPLGEEPEGSWTEDEDEEDAGTAVRGPDRGDDEDRDITKASEDLAGAYELKEELDDVPANRIGPWGIPKLRNDMFMTPDEVPDNLESWAGSATKDWPDPDQWWLYNWGADSTSGMQDTSKVIISFYTWDEYFENWFWYPKKFVTKCLNSGIKYILTPNYSQWPTQAPYLNLWALARARYVGRYCQDAGLKLVPDINWPMGDLDFLKRHVLGTLPKNIPLIALQMQTWDEKEVAASQKDMEAAYSLIVDTIKPDGILLYAGKPGRKWFEANVNFDGTLITVEPRIAKLAEANKKKVRKKGI